MVRFRRRLLALLVPLAVLSVLAAAAVLWLDQQSARARLAEAQLVPALARADAAEARAVKAEAALTAIAQQRVADAAATATAVARVNESAPEQLAQDRAQVHTVEQWLYDERDDADRRLRCFIEDSDQTYVLLLNTPNWVVDEVQLGATHRLDCPPGT